MPLVSTQVLLERAVRAGVGLGACNVLHVETAEALVRAAEQADTPLVLQISENCVNYHGALTPLAAATTRLAEQSTAPIAVHLDHAESVQLALEAIDLGFGSIMFDGSTLDYPENVAATSALVRQAHSVGVLVEAELGEIGGKDGAHAPWVRTDPVEAQRFVEMTGVDLLAVAVGSSHAMTEQAAVLDLDLIARIRELAAVPLVLHGSSGVPDDRIAAGIRAGLTKINLSTRLNAHFTEAVRKTLRADLSLVDSRRYFAAGREAVTVAAAQLLRLITQPG